MIGASVMKEFKQSHTNTTFYFSTFQYTGTDDTTKHTY